MIVSLSTALPCAQVVDEPMTKTRALYCGCPGVLGVISPSEDTLWELLPLCPVHADDLQIDSYALGDTAELDGAY